MRQGVNGQPRIVGPGAAAPVTLAQARANAGHDPRTRVGARLRGHDECLLASVPGGARLREHDGQRHAGAP